MPTQTNRAMRAGRFLLFTLAVVGLAFRLSLLDSIAGRKLRAESLPQPEQDRSLESHLSPPLLDLPISGMHLRSVETPSPAAKPVSTQAAALDAVAPSSNPPASHDPSGQASTQAAPLHHVAPSTTLVNLESPPSSLEPVAPSQPSEKAPRPADSATPPEKRLRSTLPNKSTVAALAANIFGRDIIKDVLECAQGYDLSKHLDATEKEATMKQYSNDHFELGSPSECLYPFPRFRLLQLLDQLARPGEGGSFLCPEVSDFYEMIGREAPDGTVWCEFGFFMGASGSSFLHGALSARKQRSRVEAFDLQFDPNIVTFLQRLFGDGRLKTHQGNIAETVSEFKKGGGHCDVVFLDAQHPLDHSLAKLMSTESKTLVLYHWHFRNKDSKAKP